MSLPATDEILDAAEHLPNGAVLIVPEVSWDDYERLLEGIGDRPHFRVSYDCGRLEILSPSHRHDAHEHILNRLVDRFAAVRGIAVEMLGHNDGTYSEIDGSRFLPGLTGAMLTEFLELNKTQGQTKTLAEFSRRIRNG
jgi:hypothetical protein